MKNAILISSLLASPLLNADTASYQSVINELQLNASGDVNLSVLMMEEDDELLCDKNGFHFSFSLDSSAAEKWYDTLILARTGNSLVDFHYNRGENNHCSLTAITLPKLFEDGQAPGGDPGAGLLKETGSYGNVSLVGTNGLSEASYTASAFYGQDAAAAAFDGYVYNVKTNVDADEKIGRGIWLVRREYEDRQFTKPWLQIDFGKEVSLIGTRLFVNPKSVELGRSPRNVNILYSNDGEDFVHLESFVLGAEEITVTPFSGVVTGRFFRLEVESNNGDGNFIEVDEWELYQNK